MKTQNPPRCTWAEGQPDFYQAYHDEEWGTPVRDDLKMFEFLILEGAQAGLSWKTILQRREGYRNAFHGFDPAKVAAMTDADLEERLQDPAIIRNRLKVFAARKNAIAYLKIQAEFGTFCNYLWGFVGGQPLINRPKLNKDVPARTELSDKISKDLQKRGMSFVGSTIIYAHMQATGLIDDHLQTCFRCQK